MKVSCNETNCMNYTVPSTSNGRCAKFDNASLVWTKLPSNVT